MQPTEEELVTAEYLAKALGFCKDHSRKICREQAENMTTKSCTRATYKKSEIDKIIEFYRIGIKPIEPHELTCLAMSKVLNISLINTLSLVKHEKFPAPARAFIPKKGGRYFVWNIDDVKDLNLSEFGEYQYRKHKTRTDRTDSPPFSWSGLQAEFIRLCRPGALVVDNAGFAL